MSKVRMLVIVGILLPWVAPGGVAALETAPRITDREIIEWLTRLEEGLKRLETSLRAEIRTNARSIEQLREDMNAQFGRIDTQFNRLFQLMLGLVGAFTAIVASTIGFAIWDRRTMIRPFETKVREIEAELSSNRQRLHALVEALRTLGQTDEKVADILRQFNLL